MPRSVLLSGASSGIGRALAIHYAAPEVTLHLGGRNEARLAAVAAACRDLGAAVRPARVDVREAAATAAWIGRADEEAALDLVIANAGIGAGMDEGIADWRETRRMIDVNVTGTLNTIEPALERMRLRRRGHVVLLGSLAAFRGIPGSQGYSASKAALLALAQGLRPLLREEGIGISIVSPGFVRTPMNEGRSFAMPLRIEPERAASLIARGVARGRFHIAFPWPLVLGSRLLSMVPPLADALAMREVRRTRR